MNWIRIQDEFKIIKKNISKIKKSNNAYEVQYVEFKILQSVSTQKYYFAYYCQNYQHLHGIIMISLSTSIRIHGVKCRYEKWFSELDTHGNKSVC